MMTWRALFIIPYCRRHERRRRVLAHHKAQLGDRLDVAAQVEQAKIETNSTYFSFKS